MTFGGLNVPPVGVLGYQEMAMFRREFRLSQLLKCSQAASREYKQYRGDQSTKRLASKSTLTHKAFLDVRLMFFGFAVNQSILVWCIFESTFEFFRIPSFTFPWALAPDG